LLITTAGVPVRAAVGLDLVEGGFSAPLYLTHAGDSRLFVVEKAGVIKIVGGGTFLDIDPLVRHDGERGLLGLAFHPDYSSNGLFYVVYTRSSDGDIVISEWEVSGNPDVADAGSERIVLTIEHSSASNHNGGWAGFKDQYLYVATGDGGNTPNAAQNLKSLKGKILRFNPLDPDGAGAADYSVPSSNPYVGRSGNDLVWSYGLRNPWRCSFDSETGQLWCGDVGQSKREEINRVSTGKAVNFGWPKLEGTLNYNKNPSGATCTSNCRKLPILDFPHVPDNSDAVTGGYVSRRPGAALEGDYVFGEFGTGRIWVIPANFPSGGSLPAPADNTDYSIASFGEGNDGRLYLVDIGGAVYRLTDS
jgi:glucose/arabinose dehydrogenase